MACHPLPVSPSLDAPVVCLLCQDRPHHPRRLGLGEHDSRSSPPVDYEHSWIGGFDEKQVAAVLGLPGYVRPVTMVPVGVPNGRGTQPPRVKIEGVIHEGRW